MVNKPASKMYVIKRGEYSFFFERKCFMLLCNMFGVVDHRKEEVHLDKITSRIQKLCYGLNMDFVDPVSFLSIL